MYHPFVPCRETPLICDHVSLAWRGFPVREGLLYWNSLLYCQIVVVFAGNMPTSRRCSRWTTWSRWRTPTGSACFVISRVSTENFGTTTRRKSKKRPNDSGSFLPSVLELFWNIQTNVRQPYWHRSFRLCLAEFSFTAQRPVWKHSEILLRMNTHSALSSRLLEGKTTLEKPQKSVLSTTLLNKNGLLCWNTYIQKKISV